jgi:hypothetical protein
MSHAVIRNKPRVTLNKFSYRLTTQTIITIAMQIYANLSEISL